MFSSQHTTVCWWISKRVKRFESYHSLSLYFKTLYLCVCEVSCVCVPISRIHISITQALICDNVFAAAFSDRKCVCACAYSWWRTCSMRCRGCSCTHVRLRALWVRLCRQRINSCPRQEAGCPCFRPSCPPSALDSCSHGKTLTSDPAPRYRSWIIIQLKQILFMHECKHSYQ